MKKGICCAGNIGFDVTYPIERWPHQNELTHIRGEIIKATGGIACNVTLDLARLAPDMHISSAGIVGDDENGDYILNELKKLKNIDCKNIIRKGVTSFTVVMSNNETKERTFFEYNGANDLFCEDYLDFNKIDADILHVGYILLLPELDKEDDEYGTKMARLLCHAQKAGFKTSIDVVTESSKRFEQLVTPALKYTDYCVINEFETQRTTGIRLRDHGVLHRENMRLALEALKEKGVSTWAVIHCPEMGCGIDENGEYFEVNSLNLPNGYIKGTTGAGDAFCAGILYSAEMGLTMDKALKIATCTAAASLGSPNASDGVMSVDDVLKLWDKYGE